MKIFTALIEGETTKKNTRVADNETKLNRTKRGKLVWLNKIIYLLR